MAYPIKSNFKDGAVAVIRGRLWNAVARVCSFWASGNYITVRKPEHPSGQTPIVWDLDCKAAAPAIAHEFYAQGLWPETDYPLLLRAVLNAKGTTVTEVRIYLPGYNIFVDGESWTFDTSGTTAVTGASGWYKITGVTSGAVYLVESSTANKFKVATAAPSDKTKFFVRVGAISGTEVVQNHVGGLHFTKRPSDNGATKKAFPGGWSTGLVGYGQSDRDTTTWTRGTTKDGNNKLCGFTMYVFCRGKEDGANGMLRLRKLTFDQNGCAMIVGAEEAEYGFIAVSQ